METEFEECRHTRSEYAEIMFESGKPGPTTTHERNEIDTRHIDSGNGVGPQT